MRWLREWREKRRRQCRIDEEWQGLFIGRRYCATHQVVWDDQGICPRIGEQPGQPFTFAYRMGTGRR